jgi:probable phosphoglycerate mutase
MPELAELEIPAGLTLYFARHGETRANVEKRFSGDKDTPLTPNGLAQAAAIGDILKREMGAAQQLDFVSSPLARARTTMEIVRQTLGLPRAGYRIDPRLKEIDLGRWDQLTGDEARALDPEFYARRDADKWNIRVPDGENYADVAARAQSWIAELKADTFAVSHGAFTRILRGLFAGLDAQHMSALDEPQGVVFRVQGRDAVRLDP